MREPFPSASAPSHGVQFYEDDEFLSAVVADFLRAGLSAGQPLVVIATGTHLDAFTRRLTADGLDVAATRRDGRLTLLDARELLPTFMVGAMPDAARLRSTLAPVFEESMRRSGRGVLRIYGDMVDVLWQEGNTEGALRLEELWNDLGSSYTFSLLCAYAMGNFYKAEDAERFQRLCAQHTHVAPTERYANADDADRLREISFLQQRARALEAEIEQRKDLEHRLRAALAARREAEEALLAREQELRRALVDRDALLTRERAARADAERAHQAKSDFLAMMSHELRTPLNAIAGHVQLVQMGIHGPVTESQRNALHRVERNQRHLLALINDVLNLTRIETGRVEYRLERVPLAPLVGDVVTMIEPLIVAKGLVREPPAAPDEGIAACADRERVQQIVLNLLTNAIKFTPAGGRIAIEASACADAPDAVCIRVTDTGIGIAARHLDTIFEPFVQVERGTLRQRDGVGLGLSISRDLARGMGGDLTVSSREGEGSTFEVRLPKG